MATLKAPPAKDAAASAVGQANSRRDNRAELLLRRALWSQGLRYRVDEAIRPDEGRPIRPDVVFQGAKVAVFLDGCFWHGCPEHGTRPQHNASYWREKIRRNVERDMRDRARLKRAGWLVIRIWEHDDPTSAADRVAAAVTAKTSQVAGHSREKAEKSTPSSSGSAVSLFSGIGGLDYAAQVVGLDVLAATDRDGRALATLHQALGTPTIGLDLESADSEELLNALPKQSDVQVVIGGPPCTAFSHAGFWLEGKRNGDDPAAVLLERYMDIVRLLKPEAFVMENVPGLAFKTHERFFRRLLNRARRAGFKVSWSVLNASDYGVPQARRRLFVVGVRGRTPFKFPEPTAARRSTGWALDDLAGRRDLSEPDEIPRGRWLDLLPKVPPGGNYLHFTERYGCDPPVFKNRGRYWSFLLKLDPQQASPTLPAQRVTFNGPFHWENRHLRLREMARLQSLPDWMPLDSNLANARRHIGNAVPVALGASLLWALQRHLGNAAAEDRPMLLEVLDDPTASIHEAMAVTA
jgi:DNA (cytosine-5)-methyltransferase 1